MAEAVAQDELLAYTLPHQTREKHNYLERLLNIHCRAMKHSWDELVYADLLSGPGICVDLQTGEERPGSALIAARRPEFSRLFINDADPRATAALRSRLRDEPPGRVLIQTGDCNTAVDDARRFLFPVVPRRKILGLAVIDPSAYQMRFDSIQRLTSGVRLDLMIVLMTSYMRRFLESPSFREPMSHILGPSQVEKLIHRRRCDNQLTFADFLASFQLQLSSIGYDYVYYRPVSNSRDVTVYHLVHASRHPLGKDFATKAGLRRANGQTALPFAF